MNKLLALIIIFFICANNCWCYPAIVTRVIDGDTVVLDNGIHVRLAGIDAPEYDQSYGPEAKQELERLCLHQIVEIETQAKDRYGRTIAWIYLPPNHDWQVNTILIGTGFAWHYIQYDHQTKLQDAENYAHLNRLGLWFDPDPIPPWIWRHSKNGKTH